jgi:hypothetical protein
MPDVYSASVWDARCVAEVVILAAVVAGVAWDFWTAVLAAREPAGEESWDAVTGGGPDQADGEPDRAATEAGAAASPVTGTTAVFESDPAPLKARTPTQYATPEDSRRTGAEYPPDGPAAGQEAPKVGFLYSL